MKKGSAIAYGGIFAMIAITVFIVVHITSRPNVEKSVISSEGRLIRFVNEAELILKAFDTSVEFISQRAAYDLGKIGGIDGIKIATWDEDYPTLEFLKEELEERILENLPQGEIRDRITIERYTGKMDVLLTGECSLLTGSECFFVDGEKSINIYDENITAAIRLYPYEFYKKISSNYFKLLRAGRTIMEDSKYNQFLSDYGKLWNELNKARNPADPLYDPRFENLAFSLRLVEEDVVEVTIYEPCYPPSYYFYCLAPLKEGEVGLSPSVPDPSVPYDYVKLRFRYNEVQTGHTDPDYDFRLLIIPSEGNMEEECI